MKVKLANKYWQFVPIADVSILSQHYTCIGKLDWSQIDHPLHDIMDGLTVGLIHDLYNWLDDKIYTVTLGREGITLYAYLEFNNESDYVEYCMRF